MILKLLFEILMCVCTCVCVCFSFAVKLMCVCSVQKENTKQTRRQKEKRRCRAHGVRERTVLCAIFASFEKKKALSYSLLSSFHFSHSSTHYSVSSSKFLFCLDCIFFFSFSLMMCSPFFFSLKK